MKKDTVLISLALACGLVTVFVRPPAPLQFTLGLLSAASGVGALALVLTDRHAQ
ncbi:MAG: hypothetical protein SPI12_01750 [Actinomycetaceae bacterium]|nr:hypothetical protein [Actinomycetaceae bacterium]MDY6082572.1 hypothetical protein [Actinomycetaceae bacterium]